MGNSLRLSSLRPISVINLPEGTETSNEIIKSTCLGFTRFAISFLSELMTTKETELIDVEKGITIDNKFYEKKLVNVIQIYSAKDKTKIWKFKLNEKAIFVDEEYRKNNSIPEFEWHGDEVGKTVFLKKGKWNEEEYSSNGTVYYNDKFVQFDKFEIGDKEK